MATHAFEDRIRHGCAGRGDRPARDSQESCNSSQASTPPTRMPWRKAEAGAPDGSVYFADEQTAGRGRGAHAWSSPPGSGLYVSVLLRPCLRPADALWLSLAAGLAVRDAVQQVTSLECDLRWPNDLLFGTQKILRHSHRTECRGHTRPPPRHRHRHQCASAANSPKSCATWPRRCTSKRGATGRGRTYLLALLQSLEHGGSSALATATGNLSTATADILARL